MLQAFSISSKEFADIVMIVRGVGALGFLVFLVITLYYMIKLQSKTKELTALKAVKDEIGSLEGMLRKWKNME